MNISKPIGIIGAVLINALALVWFSTSGGAAVANTGMRSPTPTQPIVTLPTITVHPDAGQLRALRDLHPAAMSGHAEQAGHEG